MSDRTRANREEAAQLVECLSFGELTTEPIRAKAVEMVATFLEAEYLRGRADGLESALAVAKS
jgi:hypothetical protein